MFVDDLVGGRFVRIVDRALAPKFERAVLPSARFVDGAVSSADVEVVIVGAVEFDDGAGAGAERVE